MCISLKISKKVFPDHFYSYILMSDINKTIEHVQLAYRYDVPWTLIY